MQKIFLIGLKDVRLAFRDPVALVLMLLAPFLLTLGMGFVTGSFSGGSSALENMPVVIVNQDDGELGQVLVDVFQSDALANLLEPVLLSDPAEARRQVDADETTTAVIIPPGYSESIAPTGAQENAGEIVQIELYVNPSRPTGSGVIQTIVEEFSGRVEIGRIGSEVIINQLVASGRLPLDPQVLNAAAQDLSAQVATDEVSGSVIQIQKTRAVNEASQFNVLAYMAPGMALMFLMFTVSYGGRSLLLERARGTLPRLLVSPTQIYQVLAGKVLGIFLTGVLQVMILVVASTLFFGLKWGDPLGVVALILAAVFGATGWGILLTAISRTPGQASNLGTVLMLTFGIMGGSFISLNNLPGWVQFISKVTPNSWGLDGFTTLALGGGLADLGAPLLGLLVMGVVLFGISVLIFNRSAILQK
ncbi:MAG: ABC transporter permease [Anaerolineales bacterium]|nr:ABC transporter permease [Anaerolineales bacterium]